MHAISAGLIYGPEPHHLDHMAPLCAILEIPLVVTEESLLKQAQEAYPFVNTLYLDYLELPFFMIESYQVVFYCFPRILFNELFFLAQTLSKKKIYTVWCPHGNSDKGNIKPYVEALAQEELLLVYGQQMIDFFTRHTLTKPYITIGNFRYQFYKQHKIWYDAYIAQKIPLLDQKKTILYAPTWQDSEKSCSFFSAIAPLIEQKPAKYTLLIKPHPNLTQQNPFFVEEIQEKCKNIPDVHFIADITPIYPLLNRCDLYIGDMSSIGYDFLHLNRPMFFLQNKPSNPLSTYLFRCGQTISFEQYSDIYSLLDNPKQQECISIREKVYRYAFAPCLCLKQLKSKIFHALA